MKDLPRCLFLLMPLLVPVLGLGGCSGLLRSTRPAVQLYVLELQDPAAADPAGSVTQAPVSPRPTLRISRPLPAPSLDTDRIALLRPEGRLDYYAGGRWSAPLAEVLSDLEATQFRRDPAWGAVADERTGLNADYLLQTSIGRFAAEYTDAPAPLVRVALQCLLIRRADGALLGSFTVTGAQQAAQNRMGSVVAAFSVASGRALAAAAAQADRLVSSARSPTVP